MSEKEHMEVTLELPAKEMVEHDGLILVRCPINGAWVQLQDYYSEVEGSLLPLVGNVDYKEAPEHWVDTGMKMPIRSKEGKIIGTEPVMDKVAKPDPIEWAETIRILPGVPEAEPEGGTLSISVHDTTGIGEKWGPGK